MSRIREQQAVGRLAIALSDMYGHKDWNSIGEEAKMRWIKKAKKLMVKTLNGTNNTDKQLTVEVKNE